MKHDAETVRAWFSYDPETGNLTRKKWMKSNCHAAYREAALKYHGEFACLD
jgi:hypothetical protein